MSQADLAKAVGISQTAIQKIESNNTRKSKYLIEIAKVLDVPIEALSESATKNALKVAEAFTGPKGAMLHRARNIPNGTTPRYVQFPEDRIPIYGQAIGGEDGRFVMNGQKITDTFCPPILAGVEGAYAVYVHGDSMEPRYFAGETVWLHPYLPVRKGDFVVAQLLGEDDEGPLNALVKQFVSRSASGLVLRQLNPPEGAGEIMKFPDGEVFSVHKIVFSGMS